jgi:hypothetical protein
MVQGKNRLRSDCRCVESVKSFGKQREENGPFKKERTAKSANGHAGTSRLSINSAERSIPCLKRDAASPEAPNHERAKATLEKPQGGGEWAFIAYQQVGVRAGLSRQ